MTSQGSAHARFHRALKTGNPTLALDAARELNHITLEDALGLCVLLRHDQRRYQHAAASWLARYHADVDGVTLSDIREIADLMGRAAVARRAGHREPARELEQRGLHRCARTVRDLTGNDDSEERSA